MNNTQLSFLSKVVKETMTVHGCQNLPEVLSFEAEVFLDGDITVPVNSLVRPFTWKEITFRGRWLDDEGCEVGLEVQLTLFRKYGRNISVVELLYYGSPLVKLLGCVITRANDWSFPPDEIEVGRVYDIDSVPMEFATLSEWSPHMGDAPYYEEGKF